jgi:uncharacterized protein (UPF0332 family)
MQEIVKTRLAQAQDALEEARALLAEDAELNFVINSLYYAFLHPVLGLLRARSLDAPMQSSAIALFEREFARNAGFDKRFIDALRRAFELKPSCECKGQKTVTRRDIEELLPVAQDFLVWVRDAAG